MKRISIFIVLLALILSSVGCFGRGRSIREVDLVSPVSRKKPSPVNAIKRKKPRLPSLPRLPVGRPGMLP